MLPESPAFELSLQRQALFSVPDAADVHIECHEGSVWITLDDCPHDVVLDADGVFSTRSHRRALISALTPSRISVGRKAALHDTASASPWQRHAAARGVVLEQVAA